MSIERPREVDDGIAREMAVGCCTNCGAVYVCDVTGHNLGEAFSEALVFACDMDWELAWDFLPEEDYLHMIVEGYDLETNRIYPERIMAGRAVKGALSFVRLHQDVQELKGTGVTKRLAASRARSPKKDVALEPETTGETKKLTKQEVEQCIKEYRLEPVVASARLDKKTGRYLQRLLHSNDELIRLRASEALGRVTKVLAPADPTAAVAILRGLFTPFETSSASYWGSIDAIGEIMAAAPGLFGGYLPRLFPLLEDDALRPVVVRALTRIAQERPDLAGKAGRRVKPLLNSPDPETRGNAVRLFGYLGADGMRERLLELQNDSNEVKVYQTGKLVKKTIGELAGIALSAER
ncbi:MAG: PBS lyase [Candidatus Desulforudis sp.]|nr:PBS lyase [Desulforudis sp.]MDZ7609960.1 PBS lyase [Eubacteriales bacterium]